MPLRPDPQTPSHCGVHLIGSRRPEVTTKNLTEGVGLTGEVHASLEHCDQGGAGRISRESGSHGRTGSSGPALQPAIVAAQLAQSLHVAQRERAVQYRPNPGVTPRAPQRCRSRREQALSDPVRCQHSLWRVEALCTAGCDGRVDGWGGRAALVSPWIVAGFTPGSAWRRTARRGSRKGVLPTRWDRVEGAHRKRCRRTPGTRRWQ
jgi:hypothetical protein